VTRTAPPYSSMVRRRAIGGSGLAPSEEERGPTYATGHAMVLGAPLSGTVRMAGESGSKPFRRGKRWYCTEISKSE
jgi:hypothetical protein